MFQKMKLLAQPAAGHTRQMRFGIALLMILLALGLAGCQEQESPTGATRESAVSESVPSDSKTAVAREPASEDGLIVETVTTGLNVPWEMRFLPSGDLLVTERTGRVLRIALPEGEQVAGGQIDVAAVGESGLLGFDLDPEFPDRPYVYAAYTYSNRGATANRLSRFTLEGDSLGSEKVLLDGIPAARIHNGSRVAFGPDGYLWMTMGEGGPALSVDPQHLPGQGGSVLCQAGPPALAHGHPQVAVGTEGHPAAVMDPGRRDPVQENLFFAEAVLF